MKSIMEEASSISKAIEQAWHRAGQPQEFTIKVLELPKTSFFGLKTSKSAKVAFFFNESTVKIRDIASSPTQQKQIRPLPSRQQGARPEQTEQKSPQRRPHHARDHQRSEQREQGHQERQDGSRKDGSHGRSEQGERHREHRESRDRHHGQRRPSHRDERHDSGTRHEQSHRSAEARDTWTPEMVETAKDWIKESLVIMGHAHVGIHTNISQNYLKVQLSQPLMEDARQEETQLKSWGSLAMEAVREKAKKPLRSLRIILESKR